MEEIANVLRNAAQNGYEWTSRGSGTRFDGVLILSAYYPNLGSTGINPSDGPYNRFYGFPLRCLSTVLDM